MRKLAARFCGPMRILEVISPCVYKLELPPSLKIHPIFHVSKLRPYHDDHGQFARPECVRPPPMMVGGQAEFEVVRIIDKQTRRIGRLDRPEYSSSGRATTTTRIPGNRYRISLEPDDLCENSKRGQHPGDHTRRGRLVAGPEGCEGSHRLPEYVSSGWATSPCC